MVRGSEMRVKGKPGEDERRRAGERSRSGPLDNPTSSTWTPRRIAMAFGLNNAQLIGRLGADVAVNASV